MKLPPDFERTLKAMSDDELCDMLASYEDYQPKAIELARVELHRRNLPGPKVAERRRLIQTTVTEQSAEKGYSRIGYWFLFHFMWIAIAATLKSCN